VDGAADGDADACRALVLGQVAAPDDEALDRPETARCQHLDRIVDVASLDAPEVRGTAAGDDRAGRQNEGRTGNSQAICHRPGRTHIDVAEQALPGAAAELSDGDEAGVDRIRAAERAVA
jgi:hypothetical protein